MAQDFKTRKRDGQAFPTGGSGIKSDVEPTVIQTKVSFRERLRRRLKPTEEEKRQQVGLRIKREAKELESERLTTAQLQSEARLEKERERVRSEREQAREELRQVDKARFERTTLGRAVKGAKAKIKEQIAKSKRRPVKRKSSRRKTKKQSSGTNILGGSGSVFD